MTPAPWEPHFQEGKGWAWRKPRATREHCHAKIELPRFMCLYLSCCAAALQYHRRQSRAEPKGPPAKHHTRLAHSQVLCSMGDPSPCFNICTTEPRPALRFCVTTELSRKVTRGTKLLHVLFFPKQGAEMTLETHTQHMEYLMG